MKNVTCVVDRVASPSDFMNIIINEVCTGYYFLPSCVKVLYSSTQKSPVLSVNLELENIQYENSDFLVLHD